MKKAERDFAEKESLAEADKVYFGVGTFGTSDDAQQGLGACYRLSVEGVDRDLIVQSVNTGYDVSGNQFDLQMGGGGPGIFDTCVGSAASMFDGAASQWGCQYGGVDNRSACSLLPQYPRDSEPMRRARDDQVKLCEYSFDKNVRLSGADLPAGICKYNPTLLDVSRVRCPESLVEMTWFQRADEPKGYCHEGATRLRGFPNAEHKCHSDIPNTNTSWCLTRMQDCRKPSGAWRTNVNAELMVDGRRLVQTCTADGYTRIDVRCGCFDCNC